MKPLQIVFFFLILLWRSEASAQDGAKFSVTISPASFSKIDGGFRLGVVSTEPMIFQIGFLWKQNLEKPESPRLGMSTVFYSSRPGLPLPKRDCEKKDQSGIHWFGALATVAISEPATFLVEVLLGYKSLAELKEYSGGEFNVFIEAQYKSGRVYRIEEILKYEDIPRPPLSEGKKTPA